MVFSTPEESQQCCDPFGIGVSIRGIATPGALLGSDPGLMAANPTGFEASSIADRHPSQCLLQFLFRLGGEFAPPKLQRAEIR